MAKGAYQLLRPHSTATLYTHASTWYTLCHQWAACYRCIACVPTQTDSPTHGPTPFFHTGRLDQQSAVKSRHCHITTMRIMCCHTNCEAISHQTWLSRHNGHTMTATLEFVVRIFLQQTMLGHLLAVLAQWNLQRDSTTSRRWSRIILGGSHSVIGQPVMTVHQAMQEGQSLGPLPEVLEPT